MEAGFIFFPLLPKHISTSLTCPRAPPCNRDTIALKMNDLSPYNDIQLHPCVLSREESNASSPLVQNSVTNDRY